MPRPLQHVPAGNICPYSDTLSRLSQDSQPNPSSICESACEILFKLLNATLQPIPPKFSCLFLYQGLSSWFLPVHSSSFVPVLFSLPLHYSVGCPPLLLIQPPQTSSPLLIVLSNPSLSVLFRKPHQYSGGSPSLLSNLFLPLHFSLFLTLRSSLLLPGSSTSFLPVRSSPFLPVLGRLPPFNTV